MINMQIHSHIIKQVRDQKCWSQQQLADMSGISLRTLQRVEAKSVASQETIKALAAVLEIDCEQLVVSETEVKNPDQHPLAVELRGAAVAGGVDQHAVEPAGKLRHVGFRQGAVGDQHTGEDRRMRALAVAPGDAPTLARSAERFASGDLGAEAVVAVEVEGLGEVLEVAFEFPVRGVIGYLFAHREIGELRHRLG